MNGRHVDKKVIMRKNTALMQYNGRSWSTFFTCPVCGRQVKKNLNFLGGKAVTCNGRRTFEERLSCEDAATLQANLVEILGSSSEAFPILAALQAAGKIKVEGRSYVGFCEGPVELGTVGNEESLEAYLQNHRTPDRW